MCSVGFGPRWRRRLMGGIRAGVRRTGMSWWMAGRIRIRGRQLKGNGCGPGDHEFAATVVRRIFDRHLDGWGRKAIVEQLNREGVPCPSVRAPHQNRHRSIDG
jgi:hypothetical protein